MTAAGRRVWRSHDRRVTASYPSETPVRLFIREADDTTGEVSLDGLVALLARIGLEASPPSAEGVDLGWLEADGSVRFFVDGRRLALVAGLELVSAGIIEAIREALRDKQSTESEL